MSDVVLGNIINGTAFKDAIHVAVYPVVAGEKLSPGERISLNSEKNAVKSGKTLGIVDPYLRKDVLPGQKFYMCLLPNTVKGMRHEWSHPAFIDDNTDIRQESVAWIQNFAGRCGSSYEGLMYIAEELLDGGEACFGSDEGPEEFRYNQPEFWFHYRVVTGTPIPENMDNFSFRCAC